MSTQVRRTWHFLHNCKLGFKSLRFDPSAKISVHRHPFIIRRYDVMPPRRHTYPRDISSYNPISLQKTAVSHPRTEAPAYDLCSGGQPDYFPKEPGPPMQHIPSSFAHRDTPTQAQWKTHLFLVHCYLFCLTCITTCSHMYICSVSTNKVTAYQVSHLCFVVFFFKFEHSQACKVFFFTPLRTVCLLVSKKNFRTN